MKISLNLADERDRERIYDLRHQVYARELGQHAENGEGQLRDKLDEVNTYLVARVAGAVVGFVSVTPPSTVGYSIDKYFARREVPLAFDQGLYEVRLLTVTRAHRGTRLALLLMHGALRYVEAHGGTKVVAIGRLDVLDMYMRAGFTSLGLRVKSGEVTYELMTAEVGDLQAHRAAFTRPLTRLERLVDWQVPGLAFRGAEGCAHGGASFDALGAEFEALDHRDGIINADVLDAWFDPAPSVVKQLAEHLTFALKTSPPTNCEGMRRAIARARGVPEESILPGAGSSDLIFSGLRHWVSPRSRVLILDPMYGEYAHLLGNVIGARVDRLTLSKTRGYEVDLEALAARVSRGCDWVVLVNPNSPTGRHIPRERLELVLSEASRTTRWWIDETYVEYAGLDQSLEAFAASSTNVVICKSMSKVYALSGARAAYLCGPPDMIDELRPLCPPWSVSLPGQIAACEALKAPDYYRARWDETRTLRDELVLGLRALDWDVLPSCANFLLCHLPAAQPETSALAAACRTHGLFVRDVANIGTCFGRRTLRLAVKDAKTNRAMLDILKTTLSEMASRGRGSETSRRAPRSS